MSLQHLIPFSSRKSLSFSIRDTAIHFIMLLRCPRFPSCPLRTFPSFCSQPSSLGSHFLHIHHHLQAGDSYALDSALTSSIGSWSESFFSFSTHFSNYISYFGERLHNSSSTSSWKNLVILDSPLISHSQSLKRPYRFRHDNISPMSPLFHCHCPNFYSHLLLPILLNTFSAFL